MKDSGGMLSSRFVDCTAELVFSWMRFYICPFKMKKQIYYFILLDEVLDGCQHVGSKVVGVN